eukprot:223980_1
MRYEDQDQGIGGDLVNVPATRGQILEDLDGPDVLDGPHLAVHDTLGGPPAVAQGADDGDVGVAVHEAHEDGNDGGQDGGGVGLEEHGQSSGLGVDDDEEEHDPHPEHPEALQGLGHQVGHGGEMQGRDDGAQEVNKAVTEEVGELVVAVAGLTPVQGHSGSKGADATRGNTGGDGEHVEHADHGQGVDLVLGGHQGVGAVNDANVVLTDLGGRHDDAADSSQDNVHDGGADVGVHLDQETVGGEVDLLAEAGTPGGRDDGELSVVGGGVIVVGAVGADGDNGRATGDGDIVGVLGGGSRRIGDDGTRLHASIPHLDGQVGLSGDTIEDNVGGVAEVEVEAKGTLEVGLGIGLGTLEDGTATGGKEQDLIQGVPDLDTGLVDDHGDGGLSTDAEALEEAAQVEGGGGIETRGGLVQEEDSGAGGQLDTDGATLALTTRDTTGGLVADLDVAGLAETEDLDDLGAEQSAVFGGEGSGQAGLGAVEEVLLDGQLGVEDVVLGDKANDVANIGDTEGVVDV